MSTLRTKILALLQRLRLKAATARRLAPTPEQWTTGTFQGLKYRLFLPLGQEESAPLLLMLHGCTQGAENFAAGTRMNALAQQAGCAVLYPEQSARANAMRCWNWFVPEVQQGRGEAARITGLVQEIVRAQALDAQRVYVAGISAGAALAEILALRFPRVFAASALHSGLRYGAAGSAGEALRAMRSGASTPPQQTAAQLKRELGVNSLTAPAMVIHGSTDGVVSTRNAGHGAGW
jgi:poly(hydroxyalkanoate) depolymerase family esterase